MRPTRRSGSTPIYDDAARTSDGFPPGPSPATLTSMREAATLKLDSGEELRVNVDRDDLDQDEIVVRRASDSVRSHAERMAVVDQIIATAKPHPAGTTDRYLQADRDRPY